MQASHKHQVKCVTVRNTTPPRKHPAGIRASTSEALIIKGRSEGCAGIRSDRAGVGKPQTKSKQNVNDNSQEV